MTITRVKPLGWTDGGNSVITANQINNIDINLTKAVDGLNGGEYDGSIIWNGDHQFTGIAEFTGDVTLGGSVSQTGSWVQDSTFRPGNRLDGSLGDANANILANIDNWYFAAVPTVPRTYTVKHTGTVPETGQRVRISMTRSSATADAIFSREDATEIGRILGSGNGGFVEFMYTGSKWIGSAAGGDGKFTNFPH